MYNTERYRMLAIKYPKYRKSTRYLPRQTTTGVCAYKPNCFWASVVGKAGVGTAGVGITGAAPPLWLLYH